MPGKEIIKPFSELDFSQVIAGRNEIDQYNPQRFEMCQLDAIVHEDLERKICVGYKDATPDEFWVRGHMPDMALMPGVIQCEAVAQLASYFVCKYGLLGVDRIGLGGMEEVRFRRAVVPGDRLVLMLTELKCRRGAVIMCYFQGYVNEKLAVEGKIKGVPLPKV